MSPFIPEIANTEMVKKFSSRQIYYPDICIINVTEYDKMIFTGNMKNYFAICQIF